MSADQETDRAKKRAGRVTVAVLLILCLAICGFFKAGFRETNYNYYGHLGQSFANERLDTPQLSGHLDVSTYQDRTYLYWGPAGGWLFSIGNLVYDGRVSDRVVATILLACNFYLWYLIIFEMTSARRVSTWEFVVLLTFACTGGLFVTQFESPAVWQMGHIIAYTGMSLVVYGLCSKTIKLNTAVGGFCFAALSRHSLLLCAPGLAFLAILLLQRVNKDIQKTLWRMLIPVGMVVATLALMAVYNYFRFESVLEFGQAYKSDIPFYHKLTLKFGTVSLHHLPRNISVYFLDPIKLHLTHPFVSFDGRGNAIWSYHPAIFIPLGFILSGKFKNSHPNDTNWKLVAGFCLGLWSVYLGFLCCLVWTGYFAFGGRYLCDVEPLLLAATLFTYVQLRDYPVHRTASMVAMVLSIGIKLAYLFSADGII